MALNLIFNFDEMGSKTDKATRDLKRYFKKQGLDTTEIEISVIKRTSGVSYREMHVALVDSQTVTFLIKQTGDIFKVKINGKELPIKNQHDHEAAIKEVLAKLDSGRAAFQKMQARAKVQLPPKLKSTVTSKIALLEDKKQALDESLQQVEQQIAALQLKIEAEQY